MKSHKSERKSSIYGTAWNAFLMWENGERKWNQIPDKNHLAHLSSPMYQNILCGQLFSNHLDKHSKRTMVPTHRFWQISIRIFRIFPWFLKVYMIISSKRWLSHYKGISLLFPSNGHRLWLTHWHVSECIPSTQTQNKYLTSKPPPPIPFMEIWHT